MKIKTEAEFKKKILIPFLEKLQFKVKQHTEKFSKGWPDISAVHKPDGETIYIEVKIHPNEPTPLQWHELKELAKCGAECFVITFNKKTDGSVIQWLHYFSIAYSGVKIKNITSCEFEERYKK